MKKYHLNSFYKKHESFDDIFCFYCGDLGNTIDHCPPLTLMRVFPSFDKILVKACSRCNSTLGAKPLPSLLSRVEFLFKKFSKRYKRTLKIPDWCDEEIDDLSGSLKIYITSKRNSKEYAKSKILFMENRLNELLSQL